MGKRDRQHSLISLTTSIIWKTICPAKQRQGLVMMLPTTIASGVLQISCWERRALTAGTVGAILTPQASDARSGTTILPCGRAAKPRSQKTRDVACASMVDVGTRQTGREPSIRYRDTTAP